MEERGLRRTLPVVEDNTSKTTAPSLVIAYISCNNSSLYNGTGMYHLTLGNQKIIAQHGCSNRSFANYDLTVCRLEELEENGVDIVMSGDKVVWSKDGDNSETLNEFNRANRFYENIHCYGRSRNWNM